MEHSQLEKTVHQFINKTLPVSEWTHQAHILVAFWHNWHYELEEAFERVKLGIIAYNESVGTINDDHSGYHETLTRFWMLLTKNFILENNYTSVVGAYKAFLNSPFSDKRIVFSHYSKAVLFSVEARYKWIEGDIQTIDLVTSQK